MSFVTPKALSVFLFVAGLASAQLRISQVYGGGGNVGSKYANDYIEIFNASSTAASLAGMSVQYAASTGSSWDRTNLPNVTLQPGHYFLVQEHAEGHTPTSSLPSPDAAGLINLSATAGKVALVGNQSLLNSSCPSGLVDFVGYGAGTNCSSRTPDLSNATAVFRDSYGCASSFTVGTPVPRNTSSSAHLCATAVPSSPPSGVGTTDPTIVLSGSTILIMVTARAGYNPSSTGVLVVANLTKIGGAPAQTMFDDGSNGDRSAGDMTFSYLSSVASNTPPGSYPITYTIRDSQLRQYVGTLSVTVAAPVPQIPSYSINQIHGSGATSPYDGVVVTSTGIVTLVKDVGFYMQNPDNQVDNDPKTSEAIFVFTSTRPPPTAVAGNFIEVQGKVTEMRGVAQGVEDLTSVTALANPVVKLVSVGNPLPTPTQLTAVSIDPKGGLGQLKGLEGMRVTFSTLLACGATGGTVDELDGATHSNGRFYGVPQGVDRPFRGPGVIVGAPIPLPGLPRWSGNIGTYVIDTSLRSNSILDLTAGAALHNLTGVLEYSSPYYAILRDPDVAVTVTNSTQARPVSLALPDELAIANFNLQQLAKIKDHSATADLALSELALSNALKKASLSIRAILRTPDLIALEGIPDINTLESLAAQTDGDAVADGESAPGYVAYFFDGNDSSEGNIGVLAKPHLQINAVTQLGTATAFTNPTTGAQELVFDHPPVLIDFTAQADGSNVYTRLKVLINHLSSPTGSDSQDAEGQRIRSKRAAEAATVASYLQDLQSNGGSNVIAIGDFNAFDFNDGFVDVMGTIKGLPSPPNQVEIASTALVNPPLVDLMESQMISAERYTDVVRGNAEALDHILVNQTLIGSIRRIEMARSNADFPESYRDDSSRPERVSDHDMPVVYIALPPSQVSSSRRGKGR